MDFVILGDLHLARATPPSVLRSLETVFERHPQDCIVFAGDLFDLSADHPGKSASHATDEAWRQQPNLIRLVGEHIGRGSEVWLCSGNHDAAIGNPALQETQLQALRLQGAAAQRLQASPWFLTKGNLHIQHGHLFDPDNAPDHPLVLGQRCLGVHFVEEFIAPTGAYRYLNANDETPLKLLYSAFRWYGLRGPHVVYRYFRTAFLAMAASGPFFRTELDPLEVSRLEAAFAARHNIDCATMAQALHLSATPTMRSFRKTFSRIYFDRVLATSTLLLGAAHYRRPARAKMLLGLGLAGLATSWALGHDRYGGTVPELLRRAALELTEVLGGKLVVFGHAHREALEPGYANTGSFAFPGAASGRPYLIVRNADGSPIVERAYAPP